MSLVQGITSNCGDLTIVKGSTTNLTCTFGEDLNKAQTNVYVDHLQRNISKHALVASCQWTSNGHDCKTMSGYRVNGNISKTLSIEITNIQERHSGKYWCEIFGSSLRDRTTCEISVVGDSFYTTQHILLSSRRGEVGEPSEKTYSSDKELMIAFSILVPVMFIGILVLLLKIFSLKRKGCFKDLQTEYASPDDVDNDNKLPEAEA